MSIDNSKKSPRLLQSRRYTHETFTDAQEAFTSVLDINANEVYVDQDLIPASSIPFGTSGDNLSTYSSGGQDVIKYYYRYKMTKSSTNNQVWFFTTGTTAGIDAQLIDSNQQKNFVSPKYSIPSLSTANAEDSPVGYGVKVFVSTNSSSPSAGDQLDPTKFVFDYKTGVLQFVLTADAPDNTKYIYITAYQYVGRTLKNSLDSLGSAGIFQQTGSYYSTTNDIKITGSLVTTGDLTVEGTLTARTLIISSSVTNMTVQYASGSTAFGDTINDNHNFTGSVNISGSLIINGSSFTAATSGTSGSSGTAGTSGSSGSDGTSGTSGSSGTAGTSGSSGSSGTAGTSGSSGSSGDSLFAETGSFWATTNDIQITGSLSISSQLGINDANVLLNESASLVLTSGSNIYIENGGFITASFKGDGAGLYNIPATGVTGLQLNRIVSGSNTASIDLDGLHINTDTSITGALVVSDYVETSLLRGTGSLFLQPDKNDGRYFQIYNTAAPSGSTDIHFKGNADFNYFGDDTNYLKIDDSAQTVSIVGVNGLFVSGNVYQTGSLYVDGTITAKELYINYVTSSVLYSSGSTKFGDTSDDLHEFTGSLRTLGSVVINGDLTVNGTTLLTSTDLLRESLIVSGAMAIMQAQIQAQIVSASLSMQGQVVISQQVNINIMDLGGF
jgi:hypothetical protein